MEEKEILRLLAARANNVIMKGLYTGDDMIEAADLMKYCTELYNILNNENKDK